MRHIRLNDGTVFDVDRCGADLERLTVRVTGDHTLLDPVPVFGKAENVARIEHWFDGTETDHVFFEGYVNLIAVQSGNEGIAIILRKG